MLDIDDAEQFGYQFSTDEKNTLGSLSLWLTILGVGLLLVGSVSLIAGISDMNDKGGGEGVVAFLLIFGPPLLCILLPGLWTFLAGRKFSAITKGQGADVYDLLQALSHLRGATRIWGFVFLALVGAPLLWFFPFGVGMLMGAVSNPDMLPKAVGLNVALFSPVAVGLGAHRLIGYVAGDVREEVPSAEDDDYEFTESAKSILSGLSFWTSALAVLLIGTALPLVALPAATNFGLLGPRTPTTLLIGSPLTIAFGFVPWIVLTISAVFCSLASRSIEAVERTEGPEMPLLIKGLRSLRSAFAVWGGIVILGGGFFAYQMV